SRLQILGNGSAELFDNNREIRRYDGCATAPLHRTGVPACCNGPRHPRTTPGDHPVTPEQIERAVAAGMPQTVEALKRLAPAPPGTPTVLLYAHYDVQPAGDPAAWRTPPFEPTLIDGCLYGRGVADDKSGVMSHVAALRVFQGRFPVGIKVVIEGQEEYAGE